MPEYVLFSLLAALLFAGLNLTQKLTVRFAIPQQAVLLFHLFLTQALFAPLIWLFHPIQGPGPVWGILMIQTAINVLATALFYYSLYRVDLSVLGPMWSLKNLFNALLGFFVLHEVFAPTAYLWIALCLLGAVLTSFNEELRWKAFLQPSILLLFVTFALFSTSDLLIRQCIAGGMDAWNQRAWSMLLEGGIPLLMLPFLRERVRVKLPQFASVVGINLFLILGTVAISQAFSYPGSFTLASTLVMLETPFMLLAMGGLTLWKGQILESHPAWIYGIRLWGIGFLSGAALFLARGGFEPLGFLLFFLPAALVGSRLLQTAPATGGRTPG
ncbi:MAG: EamA family transporter [Bacteroidota bacterium]